MVTRVGTNQRKTRQKFKRHHRERGKLSLGRFFQELKVGEKVNLKIDSIIQKGRFSPRFHGLTAVVSGKQGRCYVVTVKDREKEKTLMVHPIHLNKLESKK